MSEQVSDSKLPTSTELGKRISDLAVPLHINHQHPEFSREAIDPSSGTKFIFSVSRPEEGNGYHISVEIPDRKYNLFIYSRGTGTDEITLTARDSNTVFEDESTRELTQLTLDTLQFEFENPGDPGNLGRFQEGLVVIRSRPSNLPKV